MSFSSSGEIMGNGTLSCGGGVSGPGVGDGVREPDFSFLASWRFSVLANFAAFFKADLVGFDEERTESLQNFLQQIYI